MKKNRQKVVEERIDKLKREKQKLKDKLSALKDENSSIQKQLRNLRQILNEIPGAVLLVQREEVILSNRTAWRQLGYTEKEMLNCDLPSLLHPRSSELVATVRHNWASAKPVPDRFEVYMCKKDGSALCCEMNWRKIRFQGRSAFLFNIMDLDQRKRDEEKLKQSQKFSAIARMASVLSRNFKRGLETFENNRVQFQAVESFTNKEVIRLLRRCDAALEMGNAILERLKCLAKPENDESEIVFFDPKDVIRDAVAFTQPTWQETGNGRISINTYLRTLSPIEGHPQEIRDALVIMILNAIDAMPDGGEIYLTTEENSGFSWIYIQDNGIGIPDDIKDKIFDPFFTTKENSSMGLGLSLADAIIDRHDGEIEVVSAEGQGTTFIVKIPLSDRPVPSVAKKARNNIKDSNILIISGGNMDTDLLTQMFFVKGGRVFSAYSCSEGIKLLRKKDFDLVVADIDTLDFELSGIVPKVRKMKKDLPIALVNSGKNKRSSQIAGKGDADIVIDRPMEMDRIATLISEAIAARSQ